MKLAEVIGFLGFHALKSARSQWIRCFALCFIIGPAGFLNVDHAAAQAQPEEPAATTPGAQTVEPAPSGVVPRHTRSVVYKTCTRPGETEPRKLRLFLFEPAGFRPSDRRPCFLVIHGGGWAHGKPENTHRLASYFARRGMVGISLQYRLLNPKFGQTVADCVRDGRSAVRYVRSHAVELGIDPDQIVVCGVSAGGHLAAGTALFEGIDEAGEDLSVSSRPAALVLFCPVLDTSKEGYGFAKVGEQWRELSAIERMRPGIPPALIFHSKADPVVPYKGSVLFTEAMKKSGNTCELVAYEEPGHGIILKDPALLAGALDRTVAFLRSLGIKATSE